VTRQVKTLDNLGQFIMKKPRRLGRNRGFLDPAASGTCVTMGEPVRHTATQSAATWGDSNFKL